MAAASVTMQANLNELDAMLHDLSRGRYDENGGYESPAAPERPPPPKGYDNFLTVPKAHSVRSNYSESSVSTMRKPRHPPKLQHVLVQKGKRKAHDLVKAIPRDDGTIEVPEYDYDYSYDYGGPSNYSTVPEEEPNNVVIDVPPEAMDEVDAGEAPRGDKSMVIKTDYGELKSKYHYLGFGLWENTEPIERPPPPRKPSPPPPPPKAEPVWYNCTVSMETHKTSKELDDLEQGLDGYGRMQARDVEIGNAAEGLPGCLGDIYEEFEKEDMSEMFRRAFLEQMGNIDEADRRIYNCHVCSKAIKDRVITAMAHKFHPECFVCTYCKKEFKDRTFKSDDEFKPYCYRCFEKLLGHYGNAHQ